MMATKIFFVLDRTGGAPIAYTKITETELSLVLRGLVFDTDIFGAPRTSSWATLIMTVT